LLLSIFLVTLFLLPAPYCSFKKEDLGRIIIKDDDPSVNRSYDLMRI
jgi:hypothetical protein